MPRLFSACACLLSATGLFAQAPRPDPVRATEAYLAAARALDRQDFAAAESGFARAATLDPTHTDYARAADLTRERQAADLIQRAARARMLEQPGEADRLLAEATRIDPANVALSQHAADAASLSAATPNSRFTAAEPRFAGAIQLQPTAGAQEVHLRADPQQAFTQLAAQFGLKATFDEQITGPVLRLDLDQATFAQAAAVLLSMTHLFAVPLNAGTVLLARDTQENRARLERQAQETIYIPGATTEQLNELVNIIKNIYDVKQIVASPQSGTLAIRAPESVFTPLNYTVADLVDGGAEVLLRIQLVTVDKNHTINTGAQTPSSVGAFSVAAEAQSLVTANQSIINAAISQGLLTLPANNSGAQNILLEAAFLLLSGAATDARLTNLLAFVGGGLTLFGVNYGGNTGFNLALNSSESRALDDISVRIGDRQTTTLRVGSRYPVTTSQYSSGISSQLASSLAGRTINGVSASSLLAAAGSIATVPIIEYEDLGITLKTQPFVQKNGMVSLHVDLKLEALTGASINNIPILTSRNFVSDITVNAGGTAVMLSDLSSTEAASVSGIPGLADIPGLRDSAADHLSERDSSELVLLVTPTLVRRRSSESASRRVLFVPSMPTDY